MDILEFEDHLGSLVSLENGMFCWIEAWEDEPGEIRFIALQGFQLADPSPAVRQMFEESDLLDDAAMYLCGVAEMYFSTWRFGQTVVVKNSLPLPTDTKG